MMYKIWEEYADQLTESYYEHEGSLEDANWFCMSQKAIDMKTYVCTVRLICMSTRGACERISTMTSPVGKISVSGRIEFKFSRSARGCPQIFLTKRQ